MYEMRRQGSGRLIRVVGVGGGGCNVVRRMIRAREVAGLEYVAVNTDVKSLELVEGALSVQIGKHLTRGFGAGGDARIGCRAAEEGEYLLKRAMGGGAVVFVTAGLAGGTGGGAAPVVARIARGSGAFVVGLVTMPFSFEGRKRWSMALEAAERLRQEVDNLIIVDSDRVVALEESVTDVRQVFSTVDEAVSECITVLSSFMNDPMETGGELSSVFEILRMEGGTLLGLGKGESVGKAVEDAVFNPLLDINLRSASGVLLIYRTRRYPELDVLVDAGLFLIDHLGDKVRTIQGMCTPNEGLVTAATVALIATGIYPALPKSWLPAKEMVRDEEWLAGDSDKGLCCFCGRTDVPLEAYDTGLIPGGSGSPVGTATRLGNLITVCRSCHRAIDVRARGRSLDVLREEAKGAYGLERVVVKALRDAGWAVISGVTGPDGAVEVVGHLVEASSGKQSSILVQCRWNETSEVGESEVDGFARKMEHYGSCPGIVVSNRAASGEARVAADGLGVQIVTPEEFMQLIDRVGGTR
jgi:cell division protein FtsZ